MPRTDIASPALTRRAGTALLALGLSALLAGCGDPTGDLRTWMAEVAARTQPQIEPLPVLEPPEEFTYARAGITDPFSERLQEDTPPVASTGPAAGGPAPDPNRPREALEAYPFDALRMVGTLGRDGQLWALVRAPDGTISRVAPGNYLGQNHGRVVQVEPDALHAVELIPSGNGGWIEREASLAVAQQP